MKTIEAIQGYGRERPLEFLAEPDPNKTLPPP